MSSPESHDFFSLPRITEDDLKLFEDAPREFTPDFETFKADQPDLAHWLVANHIGLDPEFLRTRRDFIAGVVSYHAILKYALNIAQFNRAVDIALDEQIPPNDGGVDGEDQPPSA